MIVFLYSWIIFHILYVPDSQDPLICWWTSRLGPFPSYTDKAAVNRKVQVSLWRGVESAQREIAGSCGGSDLRNPRMVSTVTIDLHPSAVSNSFFFPHSLQHSSNFLMTAILTGVGWHLQHLLMALDLEYSKSSYWPCIHVFENCIQPIGPFGDW